MGETVNVATEVRIDVIRGVDKRHMVSRAATKEASGGEQWWCKCGADYRGDGAIEKGRRHHAAEILNALDSLAVSA